MDISYIVVMMILVLLSGYFSATETAFSSLNKIKIKALLDKDGKRNKKSEKSLAKREKLVYSLIDSRPKSLEEIVTFCQISVSEALESLMELELLGMIQSEGNQNYCRKI